MKTKLLTLLCTLMCAGNLFAYDFYADGIYYNKLGGDSVSVTYKTTDFNSYSGSVTIPETVTYSNTTYRVTTIGEEAFYNCTGLTSVTIPNSVTTIGEKAFYNCFGLTSVTIGNSVTTIGDYAFYFCSGLTSVTIPNSVTTIGSSAFLNCIGLTSVTIGNSVTTIGSYAFASCSKLTSITIPNSVTTIGDYAFKYCSGLTSVTIPNSVTTIGEEAFYYCKGLKSVTIGNSVTTIGEEAFYNCTGLTSVTIPNSVTSIGKKAFYECTGLTSVTIGNSVTTIGSSAFSGCTGLTLLTIGNSVRTIGSYAFEGCSNLTSVTLHSNAICSKTYTSSSNIGNIFGSQVEEYIIGDSVTTIGENAFYGCINLEEVKGCQNVISIGAGAFTNTLWYLDQPNGLVYVGKVAYKYKGDMPQDTHITIKDGTLGISLGAFYNCTGLTSVTIPNSVMTIGISAFRSCNGLKSIDVATGNTHFCSMDGVLFNYSKDTLMQYPIGNSRTEYTIPNSVTTIGDYAFEYCSGLTSVTIPNSVTTIGDYAFYYCKGLTSVTIPNSVTKIGDRAFEYCSGLTSVTIGNSVTTIGEYAFYGCSNLTLVTINSNAICSETYTSSSNIGTIFGSQVKEYIIGNSVTAIGKYAFADCTGLTSVTIPSSVTAIGSNAFNNCTNLMKIVCEIEKPLAISDGVFSTYSGILYVPAKGVNRYKLAEVWKKFKTILPIQAEEVIVTETQVNPSANIVSIAWRAVENAYNYIIVIKQGEDTICKMTFNAEGQLVTSQYYAPQRAQLLTSTTNAEQTATGWRYVIRDLESGTEYTYSIIAYDETDKAIDSQSGTFRTLLPSGLEDLTIDKNVGNKFIYGNQLYIRRGDNLFTATGARVK